MNVSRVIIRDVMARLRADTLSLGFQPRRIASYMIDEWLEGFQLRRIASYIIDKCTEWGFQLRRIARYMIDERLE